MTAKLPQGAEVLDAEWALLLECAKPHPDPCRLGELLHASIEWTSLIAFAEDHGVLGLTAERLLSYDENVITPDTRESLRTWRRAYTLFTMNLTAEMFRLFDSFAGAGVEVLVIKGPVLSARCYGDPGLRHYGDLDLIVRDKDILRSTELMMNLGYEPNVPLTAIRSKKIPGEYVFRQASTKLLVEFHTELTFRYHPRPLPMEKLFKRQARVEIDSHKVPALSPEDELILICIHGAKHFWEQLSFVADVAAFVSNQELDWERVRSATEEVGGERMLYVGLRLAADVLGARLPEKVAELVRSDRAVGRLAGQIVQWLPAAGSEPPGIFERATFRMRMRGGVFSGAAYLFRLSFSPTEEDWVEGAEDKRHWFLDALGRPFRLARKYGNDGKS
ncbi:MAG TPA: nucleotidyltransferase family protein [Candidatus Acidoferrum sp.]|nr:nucleotidyltransferase family protein [Candidatus Acidoferrum sp.]